MGTKVTLRQKQIAGNKKSLYLDFYPAILNPTTGKTSRREFLGFYVFVEPKSSFEKLHNKETLLIAEQIQLRRENEINKPEVYSRYEREVLKIKEREQMDFVKYFEDLTARNQGQSLGVRNSAIKYFIDFAGGKMKFADMTEKTAYDFRDYLLNIISHGGKKEKLSNNSAQLYYSHFRSGIRKAVIDGYLQKDICVQVKSIKRTETKRNYLTLEELNKLVKTDCKNEVLKSASLFSALTGLRHSDIMKMVWGEVVNDGTMVYLDFRQKKTKNIEMMPISDQAASLMGDRQQPTDKVFKRLVYSNHMNTILENWLLRAGITKKITFHCFRHTFATLLLSNDTDIYTVSKMLGHRDLKTTAIYAKVLDQKKRDAANKINLNF